MNRMQNKYQKKIVKRKENEERKNKECERHG